MSPRTTSAPLLCCCLFLAAPMAVAGQDDSRGVPPGYTKTAPLFAKMGSYRFPVTTSVPLAQKYIDQGLNLSYGFNHAEAARSFREAQKLDPDCAMAYWGEALVLGPNINAAMDESNVPLAWAALQKALKATGATQRERDYIAALAKRYAEKPPEDRAPLDAAYAEAMRKLAEQYPDDYDAQTLLAEAMMDTMPWDYWLEDGSPKELTKELLVTLERVLARRPNHPGAAHLYIHAVEKVHPDWAEAAADRLGTLVPDAGHLVHMPSHIYIRTGRYADASDANEAAIQADQGYITQCHAQGLYPLAYMPHNEHFLWFAAAMEGRAERSIHAARHVSKHVDPEKMREPGLGTLQHFYAMPLYALARFGRWDAVLREPKPEEDLKYPRGVWHFVRGMARVRRGELEAAGEELKQLAALAADEELDKVTIWDINTTRQLLQIAHQSLLGEIAAARREYEVAEKHLREAVKLEDALNYDEPQPWYAPTRQALGSVLLEADQSAEAEKVFVAELKKYPNNGWSLWGLKLALEAQGKQDEARRAAQAFEKAWSRADVKLNGPRF